MVIIVLTSNHDKPRLVPLMKLQFVSFHTMMRGLGKPAYVVKCAKALAERNVNVLILDGLMYEQGQIQHYIYEVLGSNPVIKDGNNLYDYIRDYETLCSTKSETYSGYDAHSNDLRKSPVANVLGVHPPYPEINGRIMQITGWPSISYLPGNNGKVVEVRERIDFHAIYEHFGGYQFFEYVRNSLSEHYDITLINAPAGHQEISGILCSQLSDLILALDLDSPAVEADASFEACEQLVQRAHEQGGHTIEVKSLKGHNLDEVVKLILGAIQQ